MSDGMMNDKKKIDLEKLIETAGRCLGRTGGVFLIDSIFPFFSFQLENYLFIHSPNTSSQPPNLILSFHHF
jgi:hypothetical protein